MKVRDRFDKNRIGELVCDGAFKYVQNFAVEIDGKRVAEYDSLGGVVENWEDYKEPLIKDEKIRKVVRAWAEGNMATRVQYDAFWRGFRNRDSTITVWEELPLEDNKTYTIAELCGEEEE